MKATSGTFTKIKSKQYEKDPFICSNLFAAIACLPLVTAQCKRAKSYAPKGYQLVWQDEFNEGTEPDAAKWTHVVMR